MASINRSTCSPLFALIGTTAEKESAGPAFDLSQQSRPFDLVDLVEGHQHREALLGELFKQQSFRGFVRGLGVHHQKDQIRFRQSRQGCINNSGVERVLGPVNTGRIQKTIWDPVR
jgi:hypothetical protein